MDISSLRERPVAGAFTVSELNAYIKNIFENDRTLRAVTVRAEISNFTRHSTGHLYFTLKDSEGQIKAVMFRSVAMRMAFMPESGMKVTVHGQVSVYPRDGTYQIYVFSMQPDGIGALYLAYEQMKERLSAEGLFDQAHKRPIPRIPERIGVITSPTGAAVRDIINVITRRFPLAKIYLYPALVQGEGAEESLISALDYLDRSGLCDVLIIGRGGGSIEDLWAFNSERLARRIYAASVPIISAVGHETDFTICDFVADMRAPTPSAAAEIAVPDKREIMMRIDGYNERSAAALRALVRASRDRLSLILEKDALRSPASLLDKKKDAVSELFEKATRYIGEVIDNARLDFSLLAQKLNALSPLSVLSRGYSVVDKGGEVVRRKDQLSSGDEIKIRLSDGEIEARVV